MASLLDVVAVGRHLHRWDWDSGRSALAISRGSRGAAPYTSSSGPRFPGMLLSLFDFRRQVGRVTQESPLELLLTRSGIQPQVARRAAMGTAELRRAADLRQKES